MSHRIGNILYLAPVAPTECAGCHMIEECRPYGDDGASICMVCAHDVKPNGLETVMERFGAAMAGVTSMEIDPDFKSALRADLDNYDALDPTLRIEALVPLQKRWFGKSIGWLREQVKEVKGGA